jgi:arginyl-tRNA synthetase
MTIRNARGGVLGDTLAARLDKAGYDVHREFYVNDAGNQVELFGKSIEARYLQLILGEENVTFPENGYHGDDIKELAALLLERGGDRYAALDPEKRLGEFIAFGLERNIALMKEHLERYRIRYDRWFLESGCMRAAMSPRR